MDCLGLCFFSGLVQDRLEQHLFPDSSGGDRLGSYAEVISAATGWDISKEELTAVAEKMLAVENSINFLAGIERTDQLPPDRFYEPIPSGRRRPSQLDGPRHQGQGVRLHGLAWRAPCSSSFSTPPALEP